MSQRTLKTILVILAIGAFSYSFYVVFGSNWAQMYSEYFPCRSPISYRVASFDQRFNISREDFLSAISSAEAIWEGPTGKELFSYELKDEKESDLEVNLIYDYRQEATAKLRALGITVSDTRHSYEALKAKYNTMQERYLEAKKKYQAKSAAFEKRQEEYNKKVDEWNQKGGAPENVYKELTAESEALNEEFTSLKALEADLNKQIDNINALVTVINRLARTLNLNVSELNTIGSTQGEEFTQGEYKSGPEGRAINIYEFSTKEKLVRVLAHELGHALGLDHVEDPDAIMYRLNESENSKLTESDMAALKSECKIK